MHKKEKDALTVEKSMSDFKRAYRAKSKLVAREKEDFLFALGDQWSDDDLKKLEAAKTKPVTDNRIAPNLFLLTGLERQNRTDFKAYPIGEEDGLKAEIATSLFKDAIKQSGFSFKSSDQFKDGITCGESHLELYLDYTDSLLNGKPMWDKCDGDAIFPDPSSREYDFSDARYVYKIKLDMSKEDLQNLFPEKKKAIEVVGEGKLNLSSLSGEQSRQHRDYPRGESSEPIGEPEEKCFDLIERYYKKWVEKIFIGDKQTGEIKESEDMEKAQGFIDQYKAQITQNQTGFDQAVQTALASLPQEMSLIPMDRQLLALQSQGVQLPPPPPAQNPDRFIIIKRQVPEIWCFSHIPGMEGPLADEVAWFYPKWKTYPFVTFFARFSSAPLTGDKRHLLIQGLVHGVKGSQEKHNKAEMLMLRHLNSSTNSGWLSEEGTWVDPSKVEGFGTTPGVNLEYKKGSQQPQRIFPNPLSQGHAQVAQDSSESIKAQLGINADLLATQQGGTDSGRAIALRQRQGLLMVQELFDNLSRSRQIAGRFILSQLGEMYDVETATKVLGEAFMRKNFPVLMLMNPDTKQQEPMKDKYGQPMVYDKEMADLAITEVLSGNLGDYNVSVGESVASETQRMAISMEIKDISTAYPGLISPDILIRHSQLSESAKSEVLQSMQQAQMRAQEQAQTAQQPIIANAGRGRQ